MFRRSAIHYYAHVRGVARQTGKTMSRLRLLPVGDCGQARPLQQIPDRAHRRKVKHEVKCRPGFALATAKLSRNSVRVARRCSGTATGTGGAFCAALRRLIACRENITKPVETSGLGTMTSSPSKSASDQLAAKRRDFWHVHRRSPAPVQTLRHRLQLCRPDLNGGPETRRRSGKDFRKPDASVVREIKKRRAGAGHGGQTSDGTYWKILIWCRRFRHSPFARWSSACQPGLSRRLLEQDPVPGWSALRLLRHSL